jgi:hypothetical protein|eukprot:COSAG06_NODE_1245_length_10117_cov_28.671990_14_plen_106_part_00
MMAVPLLLAGLCCLQQLAWADAAAPEKPHIIFFMVVRSRRSRSVACSLPIPPCAPQQRAAACSSSCAKALPSVRPLSAGRLGLERCGLPQKRVRSSAKGDSDAAH